MRELDERFGWAGDQPEHTLLHIQEEVGELSREMLYSVGYRNGEFNAGKVNDEIADLLYLTFKLGNLLGIDLDDGWNRMAERYERK